MNRRGVLAATAGVATAGTIGAFYTTDDAAATELALSVEGDEAEVASSAELEAVTLAVDVEWAFELPATDEPSTVRIELAAAPNDDDPSTVADTESAELFTEADGTESFEVALLETDALDADTLVPESGTRETEITVAATLTVLDADDEALAVDEVATTATLTVTVAELPDTDVGLDGSVTIETV